MPTSEVLTSVVLASKAPASAMVLVRELILVASLMTAPPVTLHAPARERDGWCLVRRCCDVSSLVWEDPQLTRTDYKEMHFRCKPARVRAVLLTRFLTSGRG